jgi:hypothetical protein
MSLSSRRVDKYQQLKDLQGTGLQGTLFTGNGHYGTSALDGLPCERES